jgi:hypothetical protein
MLLLILAVPRLVFEEVQVSARASPTASRRSCQTLGRMREALLTFPLLPLDANGREIAVGSNVRVLSVESCASGLPIEDQVRLRSIVGQVRRVVAFDRSGFAWLSFSEAFDAGSDFCVFPNEVAFV